MEESSNLYILVGITGGVCSILYSLNVTGGGGGGKKSRVTLSGELTERVMGDPGCNRSADSLVWGDKGE